MYLIGQNGVTCFLYWPASRLSTQELVNVLEWYRGQAQEELSRSVDVGVGAQVYAGLHDGSVDSSLAPRWRHFDDNSPNTE